MKKEKTLEIFNNFTMSYDMENPMIALKHFHTKRVADYCEKIAMNLGLNKEEIDLAWHIGIFHDLSRFEQMTIYKTFDDSISFDHALRAAQLLFDDGFIMKFDIDEKYYKIIYNAVKYHNQYKIPNDLTEQEMLFCRIIRDADMLDIMMIYDTLSWYNEDLKNQKITPIVLKEFLDGKSIRHNLKNNNLDKFVGTIGFINEIYFLESKEILIKSGILDKMSNFNFILPETIAQWTKVTGYINQYKSMK